MNELAELASGRWAAFHGLVACSLEEADARLGPPLGSELHGGMFGGEPALFRRYPAAPGAPLGITAWVLDDLVIGVEILDPEPDPEALDQLGPPSLAIESDLGPAWSQEIWSERGIVAHRREDRFSVLLGLAPIDPEAWSSDPLRWWGIERRGDPGD